jgi:hypothetical protein
MKRNSEGQILLKGLTFKEIGSIVFLVLFVSGIAGNAFYQNYSENQAKNLRIEKLNAEVKQYSARINLCINGNDIFPFYYANNPRSEERTAIAFEGFNKILNAECFVFKNDKIYSNPYRNIEIADLGELPRNENEEEIFQGLIYEIDKGIPFLVTGGSICADGSYSGSVGRGTCSWHGGYASKRGYIFRFKASELEPDPRIELSNLQQ